MLSKADTVAQLKEGLRRFGWEYNAWKIEEERQGKAVKPRARLNKGDLQAIAHSRGILA